jgi:serine/threonine protein kinase/tetratricopeptide (TPR) repeat protein
VTQPPTPESDPHRSVLQQVAARIGEAPRISLSESGSEHGASPLVAPGSAARLVPQGRDKYHLAGEIARGGMGVILRGFDTDLGRDVAFKVLDGELAKRPEVVRRFVEEAQIGGQLQHPGIVPVYELGLMADQSPFFTMKLVKGRTLAALLKQRKSPGDNRGRLLAIFESVCQTMAYAHSKGVVHRDLKPANIMVGAFGEVQVVDWGLAKVLQRGGVADERRARETLHTVIETVRSGPGSGGSDSLVGSVMGTPAYMAPEQAQGEIEKLDERADVFSLGAILCEILTGKPPYEGVEGEKTVLRAARARLDPARERIEACEADTKLRELCLDCLRPARDARPANADEVAKAIHAWLTSTEERAHQAELAAAEARIKAAEERRARRLAVALGATVVAALTLGGGGSWWVARERERREAGVRAAVEQAHGEGVELAQAGKPAEALAAAVRALDLARTGGADAALVARAETFVTNAEADLSAAQRERELRERDEQLLARLIDLRLEQLDAVGDDAREREIDAAFAAAFADYGVDLEAEDIVPAFERLRDRGIDREVALALDDWGRLRRRVHGLHSALAENVLYLAMDLDPDPERLRLRQAIFEDDEQVLLEMAAPERLHKLAPGSIWVLSSTLWDRFPEQRPTVFRLFERALYLHPQDFILQSIGGRIYQETGRLDVALGCRLVALGLQPQRARSHRDVAETLYFLGRLTESVGAYRDAVALDDVEPYHHYGLGLTLLQLGDLEGALACLQRSFELSGGDLSIVADVSVVRFYLGLEERAEIERALEREVPSLSQATYLFALVDHPDPAQRNPELVLRVLAEEARFYSATPWAFVIEAIARVRSGDWTGARAALEGRYGHTDALLLTSNALDFLRALVHAELDQDEAARETYARGMTEWKLRTRDDPEAWERSDVMRWRRAAEAALAR